MVKPLIDWTRNPGIFQAGIDARDISNIASGAIQSGLAGYQAGMTGRKQDLEERYKPQEVEASLNTAKARLLSAQTKKKEADNAQRDARFRAQQERITRSMASLNKVSPGLTAEALALIQKAPRDSAGLTVWTDDLIQDLAKIGVDARDIEKAVYEEQQDYKSESQVRTHRQKAQITLEKQIALSQHDSVLRENLQARLALNKLIRTLFAKKAAIERKAAAQDAAQAEVKETIPDKVFVIERWSKGDNNLLVSYIRRLKELEDKARGRVIELESEDAKKAANGAKNLTGEIIRNAAHWSNLMSTETPEPQ